MMGSCPEGSCPGGNCSRENVRESKVQGAIDLAGILLREDSSGVIVLGQSPWDNSPGENVIWGNCPLANCPGEIIQE